MKKKLIKSILSTILFVVILIDLIVFPIHWMSQFGNIENMDVQSLTGSYALVEGILTIYVGNTTVDLWFDYIKARKDKQNG